MATRKPNPPEMKMVTTHPIKSPENLTPPLPPLASALHSSFLSSHCSSCFLPLSSTSPHSLHYCSSTCASTDTPLHPHLFHHPNSSLIRLSLRLLRRLNHRTSASPRLLSLLSHHRHFTLSNTECYAKVRDGARAIALARTGSDDGELELEESMLCLVMTNAVEVSFDGGLPVGVAVYDWRFSWINHCCSPNSCFLFVCGADSEGASDEAAMKIVPCGGGGGVEDAAPYTASEMANGYRNRGPRVVVRSIKTIARGEEVTITYTDLLRPTRLRQSELLLKYHFTCNCVRCTAMPQTYVDRALEEILFTDLHNIGWSSVSKDCMEQTIDMLSDMLDSAIDEYLEVGNPVHCCEMIEGLLSEVTFMQLLENIGLSDIHCKLSPFHHLSLNAYMTLISTNKIRGSLSNGEEQINVFDMMRISAAYNLLLAGATHHLFVSEHSLIASAATFWADAGQSLLCLARSSLWTSTDNSTLKVLSAPKHLKCSRCLLMDKLEANLSSVQAQTGDFNEISSTFLTCVSDITTKVWRFLVQGCKYLNNVEHPIDFSWIEVMRTTDMRDLGAHSDLHGSVLRLDGRNGGALKGEPGNDTRASTYLLGVHCLLYGGYLSSICYGNSHPKTKSIRRLLYC